jgi:hypothetical protein
LTLKYVFFQYCTGDVGSEVGSEVEGSDTGEAVGTTVVDELGSTDGDELGSKVSTVGVRVEV